MSVYTRESAIDHAENFLVVANANMEMATNSIRPENSIAAAQACATMAQALLMLHDRLPSESPIMAHDQSLVDRSVTKRPR